jgi:hypothetical protein
LLLIPWAIKRLGLEDSGGMVCVGPVHYNTQEEIERFGEALGRIAATKANNSATASNCARRGEALISTSC